MTPPTHATAYLGDTLIAETDDPIIVEGNVYFPANSVNSDVLVPSTYHTRCHWKGLASYYTVETEDSSSTDAAWYYPEPLPGAELVKDRIAFWHAVKVTTS